MKAVLFYLVFGFRFYSSNPCGPWTRTLSFLLFLSFHRGSRHVSGYLFPFPIRFWTLFATLATFFGFPTVFKGSQSLAEPHIFAGNDNLLTATHPFLNELVPGSLDVCVNKLDTLILVHAIGNLGQGKLSVFSEQLRDVVIQKEKHILLVVARHLFL